MANGKPDIEVDGFLQLSPELDAALEYADFTKAERIILKEVKAQLYGVAKRAFVTLKVRSLAERMGCSRQFIQKGLNGHLRAGLLVRLTGDPENYRFNKYYRGWAYSSGQVHKDANGSRFSDVELSQIAASPELSKSIGNVKNIKTPATPELHPATNGLHPPCNSRVANVQLPSCQTATPELHPPRPPYKEPIRLEKEENTESAPRSASPRKEPYCPPDDPEPFIPPPDPTMPPELRGPGKDSPEAIALEEWAIPLGTDRQFSSYAYWAREQCQYSPVAWVKVLLERKVVGNGNRVGVAYLNSIMASWRSDHRCEWLPDVARGPSKPAWHRPVDPGRPPDTTVRELSPRGQMHKAKWEAEYRARVLKERGMVN